MRKYIRLLILLIEKKYNSNLFITTFWSIFTNPLFIIRNSLYKELFKRKKLVSGNVLDFGCGNMPYRSLFCYDKYTGIEFGCPEMSNNDIVFFNGKNIPFPDNTFDTIISTEVLEHIEDPDYTIKEFYRVLKPGGRIIITVPFVWIEHAHPHDFRRFTKEGLELILKNNKLIINETIKTTTFVLSITQLWAFLFSKILFIQKKYNIFSILFNILMQIIFIFPIFMFGYFFNLFIRDKNKTLPLNIITIAVK